MKKAISAKLVRDRIPDIIAQDNKVPHYYIAGEEEYWQRLKDKLLEEVHEFIASESKEELADILEVIDAILVFKQFSQNDITEIKEKKSQSNGAFTKRIILTSVENI
jgi:predicted house-cleaning noncanonical NTP pyrophosphatase (MazG superfamily)